MRTDLIPADVHGYIDVMERSACSPALLGIAENPNIGLKT